MLDCFCLTTRGQMSDTTVCIERGTGSYQFQSVAAGIQNQGVPNLVTNVTQAYGGGLTLGHQRGLQDLCPARHRARRSWYRGRRVECLQVARWNSHWWIARQHGRVVFSAVASPRWSCSKAIRCDGVSAETNLMQVFYSQPNYRISFVHLLRASGGASSRCRHRLVCPCPIHALLTKVQHRSRQRSRR